LPALEAFGGKMPTCFADLIPESEDHKVWPVLVRRPVSGSVLVPDYSGRNYRAQDVVVRFPEETRDPRDDPALIESVFGLSASASPSQIDDPGVVARIIDARHRGVIVKCLTSLTDARKGIVTKGWDVTQNLPAHHEVIRRLAKAGVLLRSPATIPHGKMLHVHGGSAWFGSANLTRNSLRGNTVEAAVRLEDPQILGGMKSAFDLAWAASSFAMVSRSRAVSLSEQRPPPSGDGEPRRQEWPSGGGICLLASHPGGAPVIAGHLANALDQARDEVILSAMSLFRTNEIPLLGAALERCLAKGVNVRVVVRPEHFKPKDYPDPATLGLIKSGMTLLGVTGLHAKGFLIDGRRCGLKSANFNPYSLDPGVVTSNVELGLYGSADSVELEGFALFLERLAENPTNRFTI